MAIWSCCVNERKNENPQSACVSNWIGKLMKNGNKCDKAGENNPAINSNFTFDI